MSNDANMCNLGSYDIIVLSSYIMHNITQTHHPDILAFGTRAGLDPLLFHSPSYILDTYVHYQRRESRRNFAFANVSARCKLSSVLFASSKHRVNIYNLQNVYAYTTYYHLKVLVLQIVNLNSMFAQSERNSHPLLMLANVKYLFYSRLWYVHIIKYHSQS